MNTQATDLAPMGRWNLSARRLLDALEAPFFTLGPYLALIALWEFVRIAINADAKAMPSVISVATALSKIASNGILPEYLGRTVSSLLVAGALSTVTGIALGLFIGMSETMASYATPILRYFNSLSGIAWLPLFLIWFGFNERTIIATVCYTFLFPVIFNTVLGVRTLPRVYRNAVLTMGGSLWAVIRDVLVPGALPSVLAGLRIGFSYGWRAVIGAEILVGTGGLGYMIFQARTSTSVDRIVAGMIVIGVVWSVMDRVILRPLEENTVRRWGLAQR